MQTNSEESLPERLHVGTVTASGSLLTGKLLHKTVIRQRHAVYRRLLAALVLATLALAGYGLYDVIGYGELVLYLRAQKLLALTVVGVGLSTATVVFFAVTRNRILTPGVMGFDALYALTAASLIFFLGSSTVARIPNVLLFLVNTTAMTLLAVVLFLSLVTHSRTSVHVLVLVGIVIGTFFRSLTSMIGFLLDPNELMSVKDRTTASFELINMPALMITAVVTLVAVIFMFWRAPVWDVLILGHDVATCLGLNYRREVRIALITSSVLVACATALVGPLTFYGLLVVNITIFALRSMRMRELLIGAAAIGTLVLVGGQAVLEHVLNQSTVLPVILEFCGGALLLILIVKEAKR